MAKTYVEIDFFQMEKQKMAAGIQGVVSRINPQLLKAVMAAGHAGSSDNIGAARSSSASPNTPSLSRMTPPPPPPPLPVCNPACRYSPSPAADTAPLTIFYNGAVTVFEVPRDKAEAIMRMAGAGEVGSPARRQEDSSVKGNQPQKDLPMARMKSLERFLEKRKERLAWASPYHNKGIPSRQC